MLYQVTTVHAYFGPRSCHGGTHFVNNFTGSAAGLIRYCITRIFRVEEIFALSANWDFPRNFPPAK